MKLPSVILNNEGKILYDIQNHPLKTIKNKIEKFFEFDFFDKFDKETCIKNNFDQLYFPLLHNARSIKDTFYLNENFIKDYNHYNHFYKQFEKYNHFYKYYLSNKLLNHGNIKLLKSHMTAHLSYLLNKNYKSCIYTGLVYRKDQIDKYHFPMFHQMDGFLIKNEHFDIENNLKNKLEKLIKFLFNNKNIEILWNDKTTFPFTDPSYELYIKTKKENEFVEIIGCGKIKKEVLCSCLYENEINKIIENEIFKFDKNLYNFINNIYINKINIFSKNNLNNYINENILNKLFNLNLEKQIKLKIEKFMNNINDQGWAFGIGLDRLTMLLYEITDIRLLWLDDKRFLNQFKENEIKKFEPFSNFCCIQKDISFFINDKFDENQFFHLCREIGNENIEEVKKIDYYENPKTKQKSVCYRIVYRSHNQNLTHKFVNNLQNQIINSLKDSYSLQIR